MCFIVANNNVDNMIYLLGPGTKHPIINTIDTPLLSQYVSPSVFPLKTPRGSSIVGFDVGPASQTVVQHQTHIGSTFSIE